MLAEWRNSRSSIRTTRSRGEGDPNGGALGDDWARSGTSLVSIVRDIAATQLTSYEEADAFPAKTHERALDKLTMLFQQALRVRGGGGPTDLGRAFRLTEASRASMRWQSLMILIWASMPWATPCCARRARCWAGWARWEPSGRTLPNGSRPEAHTRDRLESNSITRTVYIAHSTDPGDWMPFLPVSGIVYRE